MSSTSMLLVLLACSAACSAPTELMLVVKAGSGLTVGPGAAIDTLRVRAQPASSLVTGAFFFEKDVSLCTTPGQVDCRPDRFVGASYDGALTLPIHLLFAPGTEGSDEDVRIWVDGLASGTPRLSNGIVTHFAKGHRLWLELPLYPQCLGKLDCQALDEVCDVDTRCVGVAPTTTAPDGGHVVPSDGGVDDLAAAPDASVAADASSASDLSVVDLVACGGAEQACCIGGGTGSCSGSFACDRSDSMCKPCGHETEACCDPPAAPCETTLLLVCGGNMTCVACGHSTEPCCDSTNPNGPCMTTTACPFSGACP